MQHDGICLQMGSLARALSALQKGERDVTLTDAFMNKFVMEMGGGRSNNLTGGGGGGWGGFANVFGGMMGGGGFGYGGGGAGGFGGGEDDDDMDIADMR